MRGGVMLKPLTSLEEGYLLGLFMGDGYFNYNKKDRHYRVEWYLNSQRDGEIIRYLISLLEKMKFNYNLRKDKRYNVIRIRVNSKILMFYFEKKIKEFYKELEVRRKNYNLGLLSGFIDAEGYIGNGEIVIVQKEKRILDKFKELCTQLGLARKLWLYENKRSAVWRFRISTNFKYHKNNSCKIAGWGKASRF